ncbi:acyltransferase family protein [Hymenobacter sp. 15J16-1T3B]|uniref:acyltransferase family protein n=1 Tax=Hymenobacter sp. 15J16-1T3B TaxID=2886941 RepID=UPI001D12C96E|nr:acyltransferase family protein [Hymenobacter sp. 15J16-1T3B]MCC3158247.1 acyltransferase family protein [Hymenobacter sp. 15J16-1T3B]
MEPTARHTYLDWLRLLCIAGVLVFHCAMPFATDEQWHIRNAESSNLLLELVAFMHLWRMPLLFFVSGAVSYYMLRRRSAGSFVGLRVRRLLVPLVFGMLVVVPPQIYMERLTQGFQGSFWHFYPSIFTTGSYPHGNLSWHHLWFVAYLLDYDLLLAPLFAWLAGPRSAGFRARLGRLAGGYRVYLLAVPGIVWYAATSRALPQTNDLIHDGSFFVYWLLFVLMGFVCAAQPALLARLEQLRRSSLTVGFVALLALNYLRWNNVELPDGFPPVFPPTIAWSLVLAFIGYGKHYLQRPHPALNYLNQAAYPFYILHQTVIVVLAYYVVQTPDSVPSKYLFLVVVTLLVSMGLFHLLIRPVPVLRFLFGMKPQEPRPAAAEPAAPQPIAQLQPA